MSGFQNLSFLGNVVFVFKKKSPVTKQLGGIFRICPSDTQQLREGQDLPMGNDGTKKIMDSKFGISWEPFRVPIFR